MASLTQMEQLQNAKSTSYRKGNSRPKIEKTLRMKSQKKIPQISKKRCSYKHKRFIEIQEMLIQIQEAYTDIRDAHRDTRGLQNNNMQDQKGHSPKNITVKILKTQAKERILETLRKRPHHL